MATTCSSMSAAARPATGPSLASRPRGAARLAARPAQRSHTTARRSVSVRADAKADAEVPIEKSMPSMEAKMDIDAIMKILPHRYPFLLVDRVLELEIGKYAVGYKCITMNDNFFPGHFPQRPIMPGVLQVEAMAQLGGMIMLDPEDKDGKENFFFGGIDGCKFRRPVVPGDVLMMRVELTKFNKRFGVAKMKAKGYVGEALAVEGELTLIMAKE